MKIVNPMSVNGTKENIQTVLRVLAGGNNCDGAPYDQMVAAANYIDELEGMLLSIGILSAKALGHIGGKI